MKATVMIGDWVQVPCLIDNVEHYDAFCKVKQLRDCDLDVIGFKELKYDEIIPITITPEILEKNGFVLKPDGWLWCEYAEIEDKNYIFIQFRKGCEEVRLVELNFVNNVQSKFERIKYVHELQHALRLCRIEKEIVL